MTIPAAGLEPALREKLDFESSASTIPPHRPLFAEGKFKGQVAEIKTPFKIWSGE